MIVDLKKAEGLVISLKANYLIVEIEPIKLDTSLLNYSENNVNPIRILCTQRSKMKYEGYEVNVGDRVFVESIDLEQKRGVIYGVKERISFLKRPPVANVSDIFVFISVSEPSLNLDQASRFLITAERTGLNVSLVLSKSDLISSDELLSYKKMIEQWGYKPILFSTITGMGTVDLLNKLKLSKLSVLCGPSGVGKSSLIKLLLPDKSISISSVSKKLQRGRHTTRNVELFSLVKGCYVADTPGFNRPELGIEARKLANLFPEFRIQTNGKDCKFRDCLHRDEPGCKMNKNWPRYSYYLKCLDEIIIPDLHY
ncbi:ribosome small subunit-dependent GTPase A [Prochlorococcus sp. MIT 1223]|uniref:ribosome small subunit-dependent GTPase A n=1 Tax=Prochlorococcus sp. MIT 1223 TaxID=3096217 RepID=UPI002A74E7BF|nr:ribosome small subunit-dependent GTPase A [Prochlorococcus sp. MIT 1223]